MASSQTYAPREVKLKIWTNLYKPIDFSYNIVSGTAEIHKTVAEQSKPIMYGGGISTSFSCTIICDGSVDLYDKEIQVTVVEDNVESVLLYKMRVETFEQLDNGNYRLVSYDQLHFVENIDLSDWISGEMADLAKAGYIHFNQIMSLLCKFINVPFDWDHISPEDYGIHLKFTDWLAYDRGSSFTTAGPFIRKLAIMNASFAMIDCTTGKLVFPRIGAYTGTEKYQISKISNKKISGLYDGYVVTNVASTNSETAVNPFMFIAEDIEYGPVIAGFNDPTEIWDNQIEVMNAVTYTSCKAKLTVSALDLIKTSSFNFIKLENSQGEEFTILPCDMTVNGIGLTNHEISSYEQYKGAPSTAHRVETLSDTAQPATIYRNGLMIAQDKRNLDDLVSKVNNLAPVTSTITIPSSNANFSGGLYIATSGKVRTIYAELLTKKQITAAMNWLNVLKFAEKPIQTVESVFPVNSTASTVPTFLARAIPGGSLDIIARQNIASGASLRFTLTVILE